MIRENIIITVRKNLCSPKASGSEIFDTHNSETRNRQHQPSVQAQPTVQLANQISQNKSKIFTYGKRHPMLKSVLVALIPISHRNIPNDRTISL
ncbi:hypothetical protein GLOIN_2v1786510 [Rhizophagus irregularis DAOM 181602=DAOM 197198]|uniref:Uncharacterized protein n=1 Tax=Rhizophagus irregularis (strain DAOM 181602 / DAOM 197198 / MUCL 43194) TaxID=747089 RepID=A0A2P4P848_RHIID|nr:hypothetical protein GLOIN_2v1786510 [Rhizophagus irregularis DAOM 181602=DAOM 197198]POG61527.1 hypothetical protein GLOIN_2v1786510 [Rhizophagus irregularis DAOM 181602=DAOM 197198]|eukprot:XP_025168393.1 hypothetical protein GLOIN_2v1786510 [Rhizophagus irregularis DAOM 181602=DAOM 197198]